MYEPLNEDKEDLGESVYAQLAKENESIVTAADIQGELVFIDLKKWKLVSTIITN